MRSLQAHHPGSGQLLRYLDGELPPFKVRRVRRHVEACWECRAELRELEAAMADCVHYRKDVLAEHIPEPPLPWIDITREFARADREARATEHNWWRWLGSARFRWPAMAATALALVGILVYQLWRTPAVEAATLLNRAVAAEDSRPQRAHRVQIRTSRRSNGAVALAALFRESDYNWDSPLSAKSYQAWRDGLPRKRDEVTTIANTQATGQACYRIRTTTDEGALAAASLTLRVADLWPIAGRFEFRNQDWVEVTEVPQETATVADEPAAPPAHAAAAPAMGVAPAVVPPVNHFPASAPEFPGLALELQVTAALHRAGADLGDPIEISRDGERILVTGTGVAPQRQNQIQGALAGLPNVTVRFTEARVPPLGEPASAAADTTAETPPARLQAQIETQLGGHAQFERFSSEMLDRSDAAMAQAYALRRLAREFNADAEQGLDEKNRGVLRDIGTEHATTLAREASELQRTLYPVLAASGGAKAWPAGAQAATWQDAAEQVFNSTSRVEKLLAVLLGATPPDGSSANIPSDLASSVARLQVDVDRCRLLLGK